MTQTHDTTSRKGSLKPNGMGQGEPHSPLVKHKRRYCKMEGCSRIVKSQGLCQRHGAKPRTCKVEDCPKQAQGNFGGMCKSHFRAKESAAHNQRQEEEEGKHDRSGGEGLPDRVPTASVLERIIPDSVAWTPRTGTPMPLITHLREGFERSRQVAWHRNQERRIRGYAPRTDASQALEDWEMELIFTETLALSGTSRLAFRYLALAWGRQEGFHSHILQTHCSKRSRLEQAASALRSQQHQEETAASKTVKPYYQVQDVRQLPYCPPVASSSQSTREHRMQDCATYASMVSTSDDDDTSRETNAGTIRITNPPLAAHRAPSLRRNERGGAPSLTSSMTLDCEEWNAGSMARYEEINHTVVCDDYHNNNHSRSAIPRCDSPLQLDDHVLNDMWQREAI